MRRTTARVLAVSFAIVLGCTKFDDGSPATDPLATPSSSSTAPAATATASATTTAPGMTASGVFVVHTSIPAAVSACSGGDCGDADGDGLVDAWENLVLERVRPRIEFDEQEQLLGDPQGKVGQIARVTRKGTDVLVFIILAYSKDYGSCGFSGHNGDNERVVLQLSIATNGSDATVTKVYTAAHEGSAADDRHIYADEAALAKELLFLTENGERRWLVLASRDKHATYANDATCAAHSSVPCLLENCTANDVENVDSFRRLPPVVNAGEPTKHLNDDLTSIGFPGETAWSTDTFCGGLGSGSECAGGNADKLTNDPF